MSTTDTINKLNTKKRNRLFPNRSRTRKWAQCLSNTNQSA